MTKYAVLFLLVLGSNALPAQPAGEPRKEPEEPTLDGTYLFSIGEFEPIYSITIVQKKRDGSTYNPTNGDLPADWGSNEITVADQHGHSHTQELDKAGYVSLAAAQDLSCPFNIYVGTPNPDTLVANWIPGMAARPAIIFGLDGDDKISGAENADFLMGGQGNDQIRGCYAQTDGSDLGDRIWGGLGSDAVLGCGGNDEICGGPGDDQEAFDVGFMTHSGFGLYGGMGTDRIWGGPGNDGIDLDNGAETQLWRAFNMPQRYQVENFAYGGDGEDGITGGDGVDYVWGENGVDYVETNHGQDIVFGGPDADLIFGEGDRDVLHGESGDDIIYGDRNAGLFTQDPPVISETEWAGSDLGFGGDGSDRMYGGGEDDQLYGSTGDDFIEGYNGGDVICGGAGIDGVYGQSGNDTISGDGSADYLDGGDGHDAIWGGDGEGFGDTLIGGDGNDFLDGEAGPDLLYGNAGADSLQDLSGNDRDYLFGGGEADNINCFDGNCRFSLDYVGSEPLDQDIVWADEQSIDSTGGGDDVASLDLFLDVWHVRSVALQPSDGRSKPVEP